MRLEIIAITIVGIVAIALGIALVSASSQNHQSNDLSNTALFGATVSISWDGTIAAHEVASTAPQSEY